VAEKKDFFISYTSADVSWANWIAQELREAGYSTVHQAWDFRPGGNFVSEMKKALEESERTIAVYSPNYFHSAFSEDEWTAAFADRSLLPVRVRECEIPKLLKTKVYVDLLSLNEDAARVALLDGLNRNGVSPGERQPFPPEAQKRKRYPGGVPEVWEVPLPRNPNFTGRDQMLKDLRTALASRRCAAVAGLDGVGKTHLALEYCYRYASEYTVVWWMRAEEATTLASEFARLAAKLKLPEKDLANQTEIIAAVRVWLEQHAGWLLIFDNATAPETCTDYRPHGGTGHILITSRNPAWRGIAEPLPVQQLARTESVAFLIKRTGKDEPAAADRLSQALGDLPFALKHAAAYIEENAISIHDYVELWRTYAKELLEPVEKTWALSLEKLRVENPAASDLLNLMAYLAPDNIPRDLLQSTAENPLAFNKSVEALRRYSLIEASPDAASVERLVQQVTRNRLLRSEQQRWAKAAVNLVNSKFPNPHNYTTWPTCAKLLAHALDATRHAEALGIADETAARLLNEVGLYEQARAQLKSAEQLLGRALAIDEKI
jgi:TIR domain-containing protein